MVSQYAGCLTRHPLYLLWYCQFSGLFSAHSDPLTNTEHVLCKTPETRLQPFLYVSSGSHARVRARDMEGGIHASDTHLVCDRPFWTAGRTVGWTVC